MSLDELIAAAELAESIASERTVAAAELTNKSKAVAVRALLEEAQHHTVEAVRLRLQAAALQRTWSASSKDLERLHQDLNGQGLGYVVDLSFRPTSNLLD